jgi:hypothetical protein
MNAHNHRVPMDAHKLTIACRLRVSRGSFLLFIALRVHPQVWGGASLASLFFC